MNKPAGSQSRFFFFFIQPAIRQEHVGKPTTVIQLQGKISYRVLVGTAYGPVRSFILIIFSASFFFSSSSIIRHNPLTLQHIIVFSCLSEILPEVYVMKSF